MSGIQQTGQRRRRSAQSTGQQAGTGATQQTGTQIGGIQRAGGPVGEQFPTRNYLPEGTRTTIIGTLNQVLADVTVMRTHAQVAHWNVKGMQFWGLHELFEEIAEDLEDHIDMIAERVTALGGVARGTARQAASDTRLPPCPSGGLQAHEAIEVIADHLAILDADLFEAIETAEACGDLDTADLLNEVSRDVSKDLWFLEAHLQTQPIGGQQGAQQGTGQQAMGGQWTTGDQEAMAGQGTGLQQTTGGQQGGAGGGSRQRGTPGQQQY